MNIQSITLTKTRKIKEMDTLPPELLTSISEYLTTSELRNMGLLNKNTNKRISPKQGAKRETYKTLNALCAILLTDECSKLNINVEVSIDKYTLTSKLWDDIYKDFVYEWFKQNSHLDIINEIKDHYEIMKDLKDLKDLLQKNVNL